MENKIESKVFNEDNLLDNEIDETVVRVKAFIINSKNEVLIASSNGGVQLIGGHAEEGETEVETLKREVSEEAGIEISYEEISDVFYEVRHYIKNYFNSGKNTIAIIHYYIIKTDKAPNLNKINLTSQEKGYAFEIKSVPISSFETFLGKYLNNEKEINRIIANETLEAFKKLPQNLKVN